MTALARSETTPAPAAPATPSEEKLVLALQGFLPAEQAANIETICRDVVPVEGAKVSFSAGAVPHFTIVAWRVTRAEQDEAIQRLREAPWSDVAPIDVPVKLFRNEWKGHVRYFLVPEDEALPAITAFRVKTRATFAREFEDFGRLTHDKWWPHLTLFDLPLQRDAEIQAAIKRLEEIKTVRISSMALVGFVKGIQTLATVPLAGQASAEMRP